MNKMVYACTFSFMQVSPSKIFALKFYKICLMVSVFHSFYWTLNGSTHLDDWHAWVLRPFLLYLLTTFFYFFVVVLLILYLIRSYSLFYFLSFFSLKLLCILFSRFLWFSSNLSVGFIFHFSDHILNFQDLFLVI